MDIKLQNTIWEVVGQFWESIEAGDLALGKRLLALVRWLDDRADNGFSPSLGLYFENAAIVALVEMSI